MTPSSNFLQWHGPNDNGLWIDTSHGSAGVIYSLLIASPGILQNNTARSLIYRTVNHTVDQQQPSGNFPTEYYTPADDMLVQWDHGAPGMTAMLWRAAQAFNDSHILVSAQKAQDCIWNRGILSKGLMQCHGISGNTYMMLDMYQGTMNNTYLYRAIQMQTFVMTYPLLHDPSTMRVPSPADEAFQHWVGSYPGAVVLWADFLYGAGPAGAAMTGFSPLF